MKTRFFLLVLAMTLMSVQLMAKTVTGLVVSGEDGAAIPGVNVIIKGTVNGGVTDIEGKFSIEARDADILVFSYIGFKNKEVKVKGRSYFKVVLEADEIGLDEVVVMTKINKKKLFSGRAGKHANASYAMESEALPASMYVYEKVDFNTEEYATVRENGYKDVVNAPLSTFSIDVDAASYSNMRRFLMNGQRPPKDAVRIEEMINYFSYDYTQPKNKHPFSINHELSNCPWNKDRKLLHIGLQGEKIDMKDLPASNIVFLLDVSGSMSSANKLPLLKKAFKLLIKQLRKKDRVAVVVYAGSSGLVLPSTSCDEKGKIVAALDKLQSGGATAGAEGLKLAYEVAAKNFIKDGNNRIIIATDGDFNVGQSSNAELERIIEKERERGTFISVLGFGMGNYKDSKMEIIADKGNGNYAYIDNILEAKKVLVNEFGGTLFTIAKDVKIQIEFNPAVVESYRLIGYENRLLNNEDFDNDKKDAGELGSGHTVTALYEIKLADKESFKKRKLKYQDTKIKETAMDTDEMATVKFRYKKPDGKKSILLEEVISNKAEALKRTSDNFRFSAAVAGFGMLLRDSEYLENCSYSDLIELAQKSKGKDAEGYRSEFISLVKLAKELSLTTKTHKVPHKENTEGM